MTTKTDSLSVCFFGSSDENVHQPYAATFASLTETIVTAILDLGFSSYQIITGGYGGMMDAIATAFRNRAQKQGHQVQIIGITCDCYPIYDPSEAEYLSCNDYSPAIDIVLQAESIPARIQAMIELADIFIVLPGRKGTLGELLVTYESYCNRTSVLQGKNVKILIHESWLEELPVIKSWLSADSISYFSGAGLKDQLRDVTANRLIFGDRATDPEIRYESLIPMEVPTDDGDDPSAAFIAQQFGIYYYKVNKVLFGDLANRAEIRKSLKLKNNLLALDFGYYIADKSTDTEEGKFLTCSTERYFELLNEFFETHDSIMLNKSIKSEFRVAYLDAPMQPYSRELNFRKEKMPTDLQREIPKKDSGFEHWKEFLENEPYGQTLIWRGITQQGMGESYKLNLSVFLLFNCRLPSRKVEKIRQLTDEFLVDVSTRKIAELFGKKEEALQAQATRAATAEVIIRNTAHHIVSHISHRATFEKVMERLGKKDLSELKVPQIRTVNAMRHRLETYKDQRNEYTAAITSRPLYQCFGFYRDVILPFLENTLIMDNIAANEGIRYQPSYPADCQVEHLPATDKTRSRIVIRCFMHKDIATECHRPPSGWSLRPELPAPPKDYVEQNAFYYTDNSNDSICKYDAHTIPYYTQVNGPDSCFYEKRELLYNDVVVNLPGSLGFHSIFSLFENYLRNLAKHSYKASEHGPKTIELIIKLSPGKNGNILFSLSDNISAPDSKVIADLKKKIGSRLKEKNGMGIADMKISACLLAGDNLIRENWSEHLEVGTNSAGHMEYNLKLTTPRQVAMIGAKEWKVLPQTQAGVFFYEDLAAFVATDVQHNFDFAVVDASGWNDDFIWRYRHWLPRKMIICTGASAPMPVDPVFGRWYLFTAGAPDTSSLLQWCYQQWCTFRLNQPGKKVRMRKKRPPASDNDLASGKSVCPSLQIYLEQGKEEEPTKKWREKFANDASVKMLHHELIPPHSTRKITGVTGASGRQFVFDRHASILSSLKVSEANFIGRNHYELIDKNNPDFDLIFNADTRNDPFVFHYEMMAAADARILVIDERVAEISGNVINNGEKYEPLISRGGFRKFDKSDDCTLFDACWAAGIYIATHINGVPVSDRLAGASPKSQHLLNVRFKKRDKGSLRFDICYETNFMEHSCRLVTLKNGDEKWADSSGKHVDTYATQTEADLGLEFDYILIHRTKLKNLIDDNEGFLKGINVPKLIVITGGGAVDFLGEKIDFVDKHSASILEDYVFIHKYPTNILKDYVMGARPAKLSISKFLK